MVRSNQFPDSVVENSIPASYMHSSENFTKWLSRYVSHDLIWPLQRAIMKIRESHFLCLCMLSLLLVSKP